MFIKKIVKNDKTYFILTLCERVEEGSGKGENRDTHFMSVFIPEKLALLLIDNGVSLKEKKCKEQK